MKKRIISLLLVLIFALSSCDAIELDFLENIFGNDVDDDDIDKDDDDNTSGEHSDKNDDGFCDECSVSVIEIVDFYAINDIHGKMCDTDTQPGVDELTTYLKNAYKTDDNLVLLSSGDMWQGSSESNFTKGKFVTDWMNELDFVSMTLGNHEYDWGEQFIKENKELAEFPLLAINVFDKSTNKLVDYCQPSIMIERGEVTIGIIGAIGDCYSSIAPEQVGGVYFEVGGLLNELVIDEAIRLREAGADFIVYSLHDGYDASNYSTLTDGYVDLVFEGHTHQSYVKKDYNGVYHLQNGGDNDGISHVEVKINFANGNSSVNVAEFIDTDTYDDLEDDPIIDTLLEKYSADVSRAFEVLGANTLFRDSTYLCALVAQLYYQTGVEAWADEYDIALGGGFLSARSPYELLAGDVIYGDLYSIFPFDNSLVLCSVSGYKLKRRFFENDDSRYSIYYGEYGESIKNNIVNSETYYIVVDTYSASYSPNGLTIVERFENPNYYARDMLADFIEGGGLQITLDDLDLTSIPEINDIGASLADGATTSQSYSVKGTIVSIDNTTYGNMTIIDEFGNTLYIYGTYDANGNRYDKMPDKLAVGETCVFIGAVKRFVYASRVTIELINTTVLEIE